MSPLEALAHDLEADMRHYHVGVQLIRFSGTFFSVLGIQLLSGAPVLGWADIRSLLVASAWTAFRQWRKTVPQSLVTDVVKQAAAK